MKKIVLFSIVIALGTLLAVSVAALDAEDEDLLDSAEVFAREESDSRRSPDGFGPPGPFPPRPRPPYGPFFPPIPPPYYPPYGPYGPYSPYGPYPPPYPYAPAPTPSPPSPSPSGPEHVFSIGLVSKAPGNMFYGMGDPNTFAVDGKQGMNISLVLGHTYGFATKGLASDYAAYVSNSMVGKGEGQLSPQISGDDVMLWTVTFSPTGKGALTRSSGIYTSSIGRIKVMKLIADMKEKMTSNEYPSDEEALISELATSDDCANSSSPLYNSSACDEERNSSIPCVPTPIILTLYLQSIGHEYVGVPINIYATTPQICDGESDMEQVRMAPVESMREASLRECGTIELENMEKPVQPTK